MIKLNSPCSPNDGSSGGSSARINRNRRLAKDFEGSTASATAFLYAAAVMLLLRRTAHRA